MHTHHHEREGDASARLHHIAAMHAEHARALERAVARSSGATPLTIEDACSFAWMQLITHPSIDLGPPCWRARAWLTRTAVHEAWRLEARRAREERAECAAIERSHGVRVRAGRGPDEVADLHARLALVAQIPERPRRFLLRLALGHSYREIAVCERASLTTTNKQIARAKRLLRALDLTAQRAAS